MADMRHPKKEGPALFNWMRYVLKPIVVRSENLVRSIKASNRSLSMVTDPLRRSWMFWQSAEDTIWIVQLHGCHST